MNKRIEEIRDLCPLCKAPVTIYGNVTKYCVSDYESLLAEHKLMREALEALLNDTEHKDHNCGDEELCPVFHARQALSKLKTDLNE